MKISDAGVSAVKGFEGFRAKAYLCPAGVWTIGFGTTNGVKEGDSVTRARAEELLKSDLKWAEAVINKKVTVKLKQNQFDALCSFVYNIGETAFSKSTMLKLLNKGQYDAVPAQIARWNRVGKEVNRGLTIRRAAEADMWLQSTDDKDDMPQAVTSPDKSLGKSRQIAGAGIAGIATIAQETAEQIEPLVSYADTLRIVFVGLALVGVAITIYARWDDKRRGV